MLLAVGKWVIQRYGISAICEYQQIAEHPPQKNRKYSDHCDWLPVILAIEIVGYEPIVKDKMGIHQSPPKQVIKSKSARTLRNEKDKTIVRHTISLPSRGLFGVWMWPIIDPWFTPIPQI